MSDRLGFSCTVTPFEGAQQEILRLRNANRERAETLEYLNWRYRSATDAPEPLVFWLLRPDGQRVGMAAAIFRPYLVNSHRVFAAVVGDISLDAQWRGRGLGQVLLRYMTEYLDERFPQMPAFVIPTEAARRTLASVGWVTPGTLVPYVCVLDAMRYLRATLRSPRLASGIAKAMQGIVRSLAQLRAPGDGALFVRSASGAIDLQLGERVLWPSGAGRELAPDQLQWRYAQHPHTRFFIGRFYRAAASRGFVVFEDDPETQTCSIYDLAAENPADLRAMLVLLLLRSLAAELASVRIVLNNRHPVASLPTQAGICRASLRCSVSGSFVQRCRRECAVARHPGRQGHMSGGGGTADGPAC